MWNIEFDLQQSMRHSLCGEEQTRVSSQFKIGLLSIFGAFDRVILSFANTFTMWKRADDNFIST